MNKLSYPVLAWLWHSLLLIGMTITPARAEIVIDGVLNEPEWKTAKTFEDFVITDPLTLESAHYRTIARLHVDQRGIHIGFTNYQPATVPRVERKFARDSFLQADRNIVNIDFDGNGLSAYDFTVSSSNSIQDGVISNENQYSRDWDGTWYSQTSADEDAWYSEILIPWTVAPMIDSNTASKTLAVYFSRVVFAESIRFAYPAASMRRPTFLSDMHRVEIDNVRSSTLDFFPYVTASQDLHNRDSDWKIGMDMIWRPNSSQQLTLSLNPDFGQVESDDLVVNFSAIETFLSEKRPFFTENQGLFDFQIPTGDRLIHTRRIGAAGDAGDTGVSDIDVAMKYSHYGEAMDYGVFVVTEDDGDISEGRDYLATRVQGRAGNITLGHTLTYTDRSTLDREAMVNAVNMDWRVSETLRFSALLMHSDIDQVANDFNGWETEDSSDVAAWIEWEYAPNDNWSHIIAAIHYGDEFDMNDFGFLRRNNFEELYVSHTHRTNKYPESSVLRSTTDELEWGTSRTVDGHNHPIWLELERTAVLKSTAEIQFAIGGKTTGYDNLITRGNGVYRKRAQYWSELEYRNPRGQDFNYEFRIALFNDGDDSFTHAIKFQPSYYLTEKLTLSGTALYRHHRDWLLWEHDLGKLATYSADFYRLEFKLDWYPSTRQEVRLKFEWIGIEADSLTALNLSPSGRVRPADTDVPDFSLSDTALQLRYKYELAPLSDIFLVYSRGGLIEDDRSDRNPSELLQDGWSTVASESLIAKIRYRF